MSTFRLASDYPAELATLARRMCLHVATILGDLMSHVVVVGGLVPSLLVRKEEQAAAQS
jgi:hypothetical protein